MTKSEMAPRAGVPRASADKGLGRQPGSKHAVARNGFSKPLAKQTIPEKGAVLLEVHDLSKLQGKLRRIGGSMSDDWNSMLADQVRQSLWFFPSDDAETVKRQRRAAVDVMIGIKPKDEFEGMIAAQLIACHNASMECHRRAMLREQTIEGRRESLSQANKLSRTYATLLESLNRHRGKGQQKVVVEHVHVHAGGQAVVGTVEAPGGGHQRKSRDQAHAKQIAHAPQQAVWSADKEGEPVPIAGDAKRPLPDARRGFDRGTEGQ
jgi:hypothetical protein